MHRKEIAVKNISFSLLLKICNMGIVYLTIPFLLAFLGDNNYGVWVTIFSVINILFFIDGGVINGLKTKLTEAISIENNIKAKELISLGYGIIGTIAFVFFVSGLIAIQLVNFSEVLNVTSISEMVLKEVFLICLVFIVTNFILSIYKSLFYAIQKVAFVEFSIFLYQVLVFSFVIYLYKYSTSSLVSIAYIYGISSFTVGLFFTIIFFTKRTQLLPSFRLMKFRKLGQLFKLSMGFFVIQLSMIIIFTSDNLLLSNFLGPVYVAKYHIVFKLFQVIITLAALAMEPFWPLFSDAYKKKDFEWIKSIFKKYNTFFFLFVLFVILFSVVINSIIGIWVGNIYKADNLLIILFCVFVVIRVFPILYMNFLNGTGNIKRQIYLYIFGAIINIPLSILFVTYFKLGISGVILGTIISILGLSLFLPVQTIQILKNKQNNFVNGKS